jgi:hypothetical protein
MIKLLSHNDSEKYLDHLIRVKDKKGMRSVKNKNEVEKLSEFYTLENIKDILKNEQNFVWGNFDDNENIRYSLISNLFKNEPLVFFNNFKSEENGSFNPFKTILELANHAFIFYENKGVYRFLLIRPFELFNHRRFSTIEDLPPLNRYNSYFDEIIKSGKKSRYHLYNYLLNDRTYDVDLVVCHMNLKQQFRLYDGEPKLPLNSLKRN